MDQQTFALLARFAHELRTPLGAISGYTELLRLGAHGPLPEAQLELLGRILQNQRRMVTLLEALTDYSAVLAGALEPQLQPVSVDVVVRDAVAACAALAHAREVHLEVRPAPATPVVMTDPALCSEVLAAVIEDACRHAAVGEQITVAERMDDDMVSVVVSSADDPLTPATIEALFTPFRSATRPTDAHPLVLARARAVAQALGGDVLPAPDTAHRALAVTMAAAPHAAG